MMGVKKGLELITFEIFVALDLLAGVKYYSIIGAVRK